MTRSTIILGAIAVSALFPAACGGSTSGGSGGGGFTGYYGSGGNFSNATPVSEADFPTRLANTYCTSMQGCCQTNGFAYDDATCLTNLKQTVVTELLAPTGSSNAIFDPNAAGACIEAVQAALTACSSGKVTADACSRLYIGRLPQGAACTSSAECADVPGKKRACIKTFSTQTGTSQTGTCGVSSIGGDPGVAGDSCNSTCTMSGSSTSCSGFGSVSNGGASGASSSPKSCETTQGIYCDETTGTCTPMPKLGEPCSGANAYCVAGAFCENGTCVPQRTTGPCSYNTCATGTYCPSDGAPNPTCQPAKPNGLPCTSSAECSSGRCSSSSCSPNVPVDAKICAGIVK